MSPLILNSSFIPVHSFLGKHENRGGPNLFMHRVSFPFQCLATSNVPQRNTANYKPSFWSYDFLQSLRHDYADVRYEDRAKKLRERVRGMIKHENGEIWDTLELIDHVKRLGLSYHFEKEIEEALDRFLYLDRFGDTFIHRSLHEVALSFRLLREHGYGVTPDVLERFKEQNGNNFKACLTGDVKGMLSLYEASFHGYEGEEILDEAKAFTSFHLKDRLSKNDGNSIVLEQVRHALELPLHRGIQRLQSRRYIEAYGKRKDANLILLEAAKLDFNVVQSTHQKELQEMSRWWKGMGLAAKLSFSRDRLVECYFWTVGMAFEPRFSDFRKGLTKVYCLIATLDDVYDIYGTSDELVLFTAAVASWDIKAVQVLPEYMKMCFLALYNTVNELAYDTLKKQGRYILPCLVKAWSDLLKAFLQEARWCRDKHLPTFEQYLNNGLVSVSGVLMLIHAYFMMNHNITEEALDALHNCHALLRRPSIIMRLFNDLATSPAELQRGEETSSILCHMHENGASEECAHKHIHSLVDETWKKMNKDRVTHRVFAKPFLETTINLARISQCTYQDGDGLGAPDITTNNRILSLIIDPINNCTDEGKGDRSKLDLRDA